MRIRGNKQATDNKVADVSPNLSIITLNVNEINLPIKKQSWASGLKTQPILYCLLEIYFKLNWMD